LIKKLGAEVTGITALDYRTRKYVPASDAFYVRGSKRIPKGSMIPFVFAFEVRKDAEAFQARYGGTILGFEEIVSQLEAKKKGE
jgi:nitrous oxide reductase accessory protein NosL